MATYPASSDVVSGTPILASQMNNLRKDAIYGGQSPSDAVSLISLLRRFSQNVRLQYLATNKVRVPFTADKPPCLIVGDYMLAATANIDSAAITGTAGPRYVLAQRTSGSNTFTLVISTSNVEGVDQRLIGELYFDGTNVKQASIKSYELERLGYPYVGIDAEKSPTPAQGEIFIALDTSSVYACFVVGTWTKVGGGMKRVTGAGYSPLPSGVTGGMSVAPNNGSYGSYVQFRGATGNAIYIVSVTAYIQAGNIADLDYLQIKIGTGAAGSEVGVSEVRAVGLDQSAPSHIRIPLPFPVLVAANTRIAVCCAASDTLSCKISLDTVDIANVVDA